MKKKKTIYSRNLFPTTDNHSDVKQPLIFQQADPSSVHGSLTPPPIITASPQVASSLNESNVSTVYDPNTPPDVKKCNTPSQTKKYSKSKLFPSSSTSSFTQKDENINEAFISRYWNKD